MNFVIDFTQSIFVLAGLIALGALMRVKGLFKPEHGALFAKVVTNITLPALIFSSLAAQKIDLAQMEQPLLMGMAELVCIAAAWWIGGMLRLPGPQKGAFILVSAFGSSAFLGYPIIKAVFPGDTAAMADAIVTSELGVGVFIFTLGVMIAMYFGGKTFRAGEAGKVFLSFLRSPVFVALSAGLLVSICFRDKDNVFFRLLLDLTRTLGAANTVFVVFSVGIVLEAGNFRALLPAALLVCLLKLILKPVLVAVPADILGFPLMWKKVMVIEAAMPSAALSVVFSSRYGCDGAFASRLLMITLFASIITMIGVAAFLL
jgi:malate permease and related proteins